MQQLDQYGAASGFFSASQFLNSEGLPLTPEVGSRDPSSPKMAAAGEDLEEPRLSELFETCKQILEEIDLATEPSGSKMFQNRVAEGLEFLKKAAEMLRQLDLFSRNEELEEIASADLKYLMVPAFQGSLTLKQVKPSKRLEHLFEAREHFLNYLTQCQYYHVADFELPLLKRNLDENNTPSSSMAYPNLVTMASQRQAKIERYRLKKEVENRLSALKSSVENCEADDECIREYYILHLRKWISISLEEIESIDQEIRILKNKDSLKEAPASQSSQQDRPAMKPFILTRNVTQAKVFGAGYPSLATMTVNEWYEQHQKYNTSDHGITQTSEFRKASEQQDQEEKEEDEQKLRQSREWDDWKDTHPRGYGNRQNMG